MNKSIVIGMATGVVAAGGAGALATHGQLPFTPPEPTSAEVVSVTPLTTTVTTPRKACHKEQVTVHTAPKDQHQIAGTLIGAAVGGILLNQIGGGVFKALATTAGVIGGGYAGNRIEASTQKGRTRTVTRERCVTAYDTTTVPSGYEVSYTFKGKTEVVQMDHDPGKQIALKDGKPDLAAYSDERTGQGGQGGQQGGNNGQAAENGHPG
jgi:uncharacterized protein YcfJ